MSRPRGGDWLEDEVAILKRGGVDCVISLLEEDEVRELDLASERFLCEARGIEFRSFPIPDRGVPESVLSFRALVAEIEQRLGDGKAVVVHCRVGVGRSAILTAAVLCSLGLDVCEAFERVAQARGMTVPDTPRQKEWLASFSRSCQGRFRGHT